MSLSRFRVTLWDTTGSGRGRGSLRAIIEDATDVGGSAYANGGGEFFMTLPYNHAYANEIDPLLRHYEVSRLDSTGTYVPIFTGLIDGVEVSRDELVVHGRDYLSLLETTISAANTSYASTLIGTIISSQLTAARAEANSRVNFISVGTIESTSTTATLLTSYQSRLDFISSACDILMADRSVKSIIAVEPRSSGTPSFTFYENKGSDKEGVRLEYGAAINDFIIVTPWQGLRTRVNAIGQKREGATLLFSTQTYANEATYGWITEPAVFIDIIDQTALDQKTRRMARRLGNTNATQVLMGLKPTQFSSIPYVPGPWQGYDIGDNIRVIIDRTQAGAAGTWDYTNGLYTVWGVEWTGLANGQEELFLDLRPKET